MTRIEDDSPHKIALTAAMVSETNATAEIKAAKAGLLRQVGYGLTGLGIGAGAAVFALAYSFIPAANTVRERVVIQAPSAAPRDTAPAADTARPTPRQLQREAVPASKAKVVTNFVIFKTVPVGESGEVQTGWRFEDSNQALPTFAYCNFVLHSPSGLDTLVKIGVDGHMELPKTKLQGVDLAALYRNCVWASSDVKAASAK